MAKVNRLSYIGSKFQLMDWIQDTISEKTQWTTFQDKTVADLFSGTGIVSYHFRCMGAVVLSNDAELYSSIITHALTRSVYNEACRDIITSLQNEAGERVGFITRHYSPYEENERKFFTVENAKRIDYLRDRIETLKPYISEDEYAFVMASLLISADAVSNVPAVYGCFLKNFKAKANKALVLHPVHMIEEACHPASHTTHKDVLDLNIKADMVYLDPPYNQRQYSKNYFPLNIIAQNPKEAVLKGKTGIPTDCFISPFCKKGAVVEQAFDKMFQSLDTPWIFLSYNSESLVSKDTMLEIMGRYGKASVVERDYKRFKSFDYNKDILIKEYLFCLEKKNVKV